MTALRVAKKTRLKYIRAAHKCVYALSVGLTGLRQPMGTWEV